MEKREDLKELLIRLKQGDQTAFETIFNRYHRAAMSWAQSIVRDPYLADDVVQEAFIRMKDKVHQLKDDYKFTSWFRLMIRRMSINAIRRASYHQIHNLHELPEAEKEEWSESHDWQELADNDVMVRHTLSKLSRQSRDILNASIYEEATPEELAVQFNIKKSNVYNIISRARVKANDERFQSEIASYLLDRRTLGHHTSCLLPPPSYAKPYAFISVLIGEALRSAEMTNFTYTELMGISADAFRMNMPENCNWQGILTYDWSYAAYRTIERLGFSGVCFGRPQLKIMTPDMQVQMLSVIHGSIERGIPAVIWNMEMNEMGFAHGYDDDRQEIQYRGYNGAGQIYRYEQLGRNAEEQAVFVFGLRRRVSQTLSENEVLRAIVDHARGKEPPLKGYAYGLNGYRYWLEAVERNTLNLSGHAYQVAILSEARHQAALYLEQISETVRGIEYKKHLVAAADCYKRVSQLFTQLYPRFPFGYGGSHANRLHDIQKILRAAWEAEKEGISCIEKYIFSE
ncbi:MAG: RNA polymerase sigma factor [Paenibacillaceae bacterium]